MAPASKSGADHYDGDTRPMLARLDDSSLLRQQCLVDGQWVGVPADPVHDPATGEVVAHVPRMGTADTHAAIDAAARAFKAWSSMLASERGAALRRWADLIVQHASDLAR